MLRKRPKHSSSDEEMCSSKNLLEACQSGNEIEVKQILSDKTRLKSQLNSKDNHNWSPLHHAVNSDNLQCVKLLLNEQDLDTKAESFEGWTALFIACSKPSASLEIVQALLQTDPELIFYVNNERETVLQKAVEVKNLALVKLLLDAGFPIDWTDLDNETALHIAVRCESKEIIELLLYSNCDPTITNFYDLNALELHIALYRTKRFKILDLLLDFIPVDLTDLMVRCIAHLNYRNFIHLIKKFYLVPTNSKIYFLNILMKSFPLEKIEIPLMNTLLILYAVMFDGIDSIDKLKSSCLAPNHFKWNDLYFILCKIYNDQGFDVFLEILSEIMSKGFDFKKALKSMYSHKGCLSLRTILNHYAFCSETKQFTKHGFTVDKFNKFIETLLKMDAFNADCILDCLFDYFDPNELTTVECLLYLLSKFRTKTIYLHEDYLTDESIFYDWSESRNFCSKFKNVKSINPQIVRLYEMYGSRNFPKIIKKVDPSVILIPKLTNLCRFVILESLDETVIERKQYADLPLPECLIKFLKFDYS